MSKEKKIRSRVPESPYCSVDEMHILPVEGGKKPLKGSPEMRAKMAKIRSMRGKGKTGGAMKCAESVESGEGGAVPYGAIASVLSSLVLPIVQHEIMSLYAKHRYNKKNQD
jgi:hypothetical protein